MILSDHAKRAMRARGISRDVALELVHNPQVIEPCLPSKKNPQKGLERRVRGCLAAVVQRRKEDGHPVVITFLLRRNGRWTDEDVRAAVKAST